MSPLRSAAYAPMLIAAVVRSKLGYPPAASRSCSSPVSIRETPAPKYPAQSPGSGSPNASSRAVTRADRSADRSCAAPASAYASPAASANSAALPIRNPII